MIYPDTNRTAEPLKYQQLVWGDLIHGTKSQLQSLGIGLDQAFPGEQGRKKKWQITVLDPRGFETRIAPSRYEGEGIYCASIRFPGRSFNRWESRLVEIATGVTLVKYIWRDCYRGSKEALCAAGLVEPWQFPGQPGMRKMRVTILASGQVLGGPPYCE